MISVKESSLEGLFRFKNSLKVINDKSGTQYEVIGLELKKYGDVLKDYWAIELAGGYHISLIDLAYDENQCRLVRKR